MINQTQINTLRLKNLLNYQFYTANRIRIGNIHLEDDQFTINL